MTREGSVFDCLKKRLLIQSKLAQMSDKVSNKSTGAGKEVRVFEAKNKLRLIDPLQSCPPVYIGELNCTPP